MPRWSSKLSPRRWFISRCTRFLTAPLETYEQRVPNSVEKLKKTLQKGDVLLVEGDQRVSQVIRYLTQSSWSHSALFIGDELLKNDSQYAADVTERYGPEARHLLIEADFGDGVVASPLTKYEPFNLRICRPHRLRREDVEQVIAYAISQLGHAYDVRHIYDLARYFFPVSAVPRRWRRAALHLGSGSEREVICSSMIAKAFASVGFPIAPQVTFEDHDVPQSLWRRIILRNGQRALARFRRQDPALITPRDFDLSPYFEIVKFNHLGVGDPRFSYRDIVWENDGDSAAAPLDTTTADSA